MTLREVCRAYTTRNNTRAWIEVTWTSATYFASLAIAIWITNTWGWPWAIPFMATFGAMGVRSYMLQHDCMHGCLFSSRKMNDLVGSLISPLSLNPYKATRRAHNLHHAHVSDLDRRDTFEIQVMTVEEYAKASTLRKLGYRLYRSPLTLNVVGPFLLYTLGRRFPKHAMSTGMGDLLLHNAMIAGLLALLFALAGWTGIYVLLGSIWIGTAVGAIIPYVVHNFEEIEWQRQPEWNFQDGSLNGSAVMDFGNFFHFLTFNIAFHDLHHLNAQIPGYHLKACHEELEEKGLIDSHKIGWWEAWGCLRWKLYDEQGKKMVGFPPLADDLRRTTSQPA